MSASHRISIKFSSLTSTANKDLIKTLIEDLANNLYSGALYRRLDFGAGGSIINSTVPTEVRNCGIASAGPLLGLAHEARLGCPILEVRVFSSKYALVCVSQLWMSADASEVGCF
jgi:hypothetical protein